MSEYQYYEFLALDRPLTEKERAELRSISTRADITAERQDDPAAFRKRFGELRAQHRRKPSLLDRFDRTGLPS